jgi:hypothetical protein
MTAKDLQLDYFQFYALENPKDVRELSPAVMLKGQFDEEAEWAKLASLTLFGNPVAKNKEAIFDKNAHLAWYKLLKITDPFEKLTVQIENQFGRQEILIYDVRAVLVPAQKAIVKLIELPGRSKFSRPTKLDHYKIYRVIEGKPVNKPIHLEDQFHRMETGVYFPTGFAVPVTKEHHGKTSPIHNAKAHLTIYQMKPSGDMRQVINVRDQFGTYRYLKIGVSYLLGVPSKKLKWRKVE